MCRTIMASREDKPRSKVGTYDQRGRRSQPGQHVLALALRIKALLSLWKGKVNRAATPTGLCHGLIPQSARQVA